MAEIWKKLVDWGGLILWSVVCVIVLILALQNPDARSVVGNYRFGSEAFLAGQSPYNVKVAMGYLYTPAFAVLYIPFMQLGAHLGDSLWRLFGIAVLTYAVYRQMRRIGNPNPIWFMSCTLFLALPMTAGALRNGQATILLTGACWLLTLSALEGKKAETFLWASLAIIAKPTAIVMLLLVGALRFRMIPVLVLSIVFVLVIPYAFGPFGYINRLNGDFLGLMTAMSVDKSAAFITADFTSPFAEFGMPISTDVATGIRMVVALLTLAAVIWYDRNLDAKLVALVVFVLAAFYMCVFNPRVESSTYAMLAVPCGMAITYIWQMEGRGLFRVLLAGALMAAGLTGVVREVNELLQPWFRSIAVTVITMTVLWWYYSQARRSVQHVRTGAHAAYQAKS
ncbi:glycosyltransferase family 87 protein [Corticibacterium sp. UT-5YL-CI-8]|nr:glycosyltransferase family 87 protein [Tianweitania sp. UT-5YL-CI-8]